MARGDQLARQWKIITLLMSSRRGRSVAEVAAELDTNPRNVYRDLHALEEAGFPIYNDRVEGKGLWSVLDTVRHHIPAPFTLPELMALYFGRGMLRAFRGTFFYESLESLFGKIRANLPEQSLRFLERAEATLHVDLRPFKPYERFKEIIESANHAALDRDTVEIVHHTMGSREESRRRVDPYAVWFHNGTFYLIGHCHLRGEVRMFAMDRIRMLHRTGVSFPAPEGFDVEEYLGASFGAYRGEPERIRVRFSPGVAGYIREKVWHPTQRIEENPDGSIVFEAVAAGMPEIRSWVMSWGAEAEVLEPQSLRKGVRAQAEQMASAYAGKTRATASASAPAHNPGAARKTTRRGAKA